MSTPLILALLASALLHAVWNAIIKGGGNKLFEAVMKTSGGGLIALPFILYLPLPEPAARPFLAGSVTIHIFYYLLLANSYKSADMSYSYTIMRGTAPLFTALVAVFLLNDPLGAGGWGGVLLLSAGIFVLAWDALKRGQFMFRPTALALANAVVIMGYTVMDGSGVRLSGNAVAYVCWVFFLNAFPILIYSLIRYGGAYFRYARQRWRYGLAGGACSMLAYGLSVWAMAFAPISLVAALRETSVIFGMILGVVYLKEQFSFLRALSVFLVLAGAVCIKVLA